MHALGKVVGWAIWWNCLSVAVLVGVAWGQSAPSGSNVILSGSQEVPPVTSTATGAGTIRGLNDRSVSGSVTTTGVTGTPARRGR